MTHFEITKKAAVDDKETKWSWLRALGFVLAVLVTGLAFILWMAVSWMNATLRIKFGELLYTMTTPLKGADTGLVIQCLHASGTQISLFLLYLFALAAVIIIQRRYTVVYHSEKRGNWDLVKFSRRSLMCISGIVLISSLIFTERTFQIIDYIQMCMSPSSLYEENYIDPLDVNITGEGKNLIYIYLESMETTYASQEAGGHQPVNNYISGLTQLAGANISFSNSDKLGGFHSINGITWTMGALLATTSGIPYSFPSDMNAMGKWEKFAPGLTNLGDILKEKGYQNEFLCGSKAGFAGRDTFFTQHGAYKIFDLYSAREAGYIAPDYKVWWGYEDMYLYQIAKDELTELSQSGRPFNFTMLTVDTHHVGGYVCSLCDNEYDVITANVVSCADRQVMDFIDWCKQQDFYEDSVIIISGDHPRMDLNLVEDVEYLDRTIYNCFLNSAKQPQGDTDYRDFTAMDMFPTILSAMGFEIEGDRLGLGVDLFSGEPTLCEQMGVEELQEEVQKYSAYYMKNFG